MQCKFKKKNDKYVELLQCNIKLDSCWAQLGTEYPQKILLIFYN